MRPTFEVERIREVDSDRLAVLRPEEVLADLSADGSSWLLGEFTWADVKHWIEHETLALDELDGASATEEEFERRAGDWPYDCDEPWPHVDLGAVSIVAALNAGGCPTTWSTRGRGGEAPGVVFFADPPRARLVLAVADELDLRLTKTQQGLLDLSAGSADELVAAARALVAWSEEFDSLPPSSTAGLLGPDGYWAEDLAEVRETLEIE